MIKIPSARIPLKGMSPLSNRCRGFLDRGRASLTDLHADQLIATFSAAVQERFAEVDAMLVPDSQAAANAVDLLEHPPQIPFSGSSNKHLTALQIDRADHGNKHARETLIDYRTEMNATQAVLAAQVEAAGRSTTAAFLAYIRGHRISRSSVPVYKTDFGNKLNSTICTLQAAHKATYAALLEKIDKLV